MEKEPSAQKEDIEEQTTQHAERTKARLTSDPLPSGIGAFWQNGRRFIFEKIPFAITGFIATAINYGMFLLLVDRVLPPVPATIVAYSSSVVLNYFMQRYFVFELKRSPRSAFALSMLVSVGGLLLDAALVAGLNLLPAFRARQWLTKLIATGLVFFYNYYGKRRVFEGR